MENEENQRQVSLVSHSPWKSPSAIPTFPQPRRRLLGKVEIQKQDSHFPSVVVSLITNSERRFPRTPGSPSFRLIVRLEYAAPRKQIQPESGPELAFGQALREVRESRQISQERLELDAVLDRTYI